eukprot:9990818-Alexandrium_andersonii.AAC.1
MGTKVPPVRLLGQGSAAALQRGPGDAAERAARPGSVEDEGLRAVALRHGHAASDERDVRQEGLDAHIGRRARELAHRNDQDVVGKQPGDAMEGTANAEPGERQHGQERHAERVPLGDRALPGVAAPDPAGQPEAVREPGLELG